MIINIMAYRDDILHAALRCGDLLSRLSGNNILVTGATGLIGACLVKVLMCADNMDFDVYASGRNEERARELFKDYFDNPHFHFVRMDIMEPLDLATRFQYIVHAASYAGPVDFLKSPVEIIKANIVGLSNLLDYGRFHGLKRMLYVSSGEVYGHGDGRVFDEDYLGPCDISSIRSCYPSAKRAAESLCVAYSYEYAIECVIARPCHVYGPEFTMRDSRAFAQFIRSARDKCDIVLNSAGKQLRSWCYVVDCVTALLYIMLSGQSGEAYNVADCNSTATVREFAEICAKMGGCEVKCLDESMTDDFASRQSVYSVKKLCALGWNPGTLLEHGIQNSI